MRANRARRHRAATTTNFNTIVDANVVTMITAFVLYAVATSGSRAAHALVGTLSFSMVTAVAQRSRSSASSPASAGSTTPRSWARRRRRSPPGSASTSSGRARLWFAISGAVIAIGIGSLIFQGLNLGIDFQGGSQITFETPQAASRTSAEAAEIGRASTRSSRAEGEIENGGYRQFTL